MVPDEWVPDDVLAEAMEDAIYDDAFANDLGFTGECQEAVPFGETFTLIIDGREYLTCTHTPPHNRPA